MSGFSAGASAIPSASSRSNGVRIAGVIAVPCSRAFSRVAMSWMAERAAPPRPASTTVRTWPADVTAQEPRSKPAQHLEDASVAGEPVEQGMTGGHGVLWSRSLPARHIATVDQNRQPCAAFAAAPRHRDHATR
jgi:hypothetical protein